MKKGLEYAQSLEKQLFDRAFSIPASIANPVVTKALQLSVRMTDASIDPYFRQERIGKDGQPITITKVRSLWPHDNKTPINKFVRIARATGIDELQQGQLIRQGLMSVVGFRPLHTERFTEFMDNLDSTTRNQYLNTVLPTRPGLVSSFVIEEHTGTLLPEDCARHAEHDIQDVIDGSLAYDMSLIGKLMKHIVRLDMIDPLSQGS